MRFVLDASITLCWCFRDENQSVADQAAQLLLEAGQALCPAIWWFEVRNAMLAGIKRNRASEADVRAFLSDLPFLKIDVEGLPGDSEIFALASRHNLTFYDAAYLELARREKIALATLDRALARAAAAEGVALIGQ
ncbi:MAG: type II toxin-antitoxin system VapC family toxin [Proteobacteria bacterium]|nr:type II toxin-antitoxin system VapC family toxin [Pseudomonadota bacterium]